jgi:hypothetical protein
MERARVSRFGTVSLAVAGAFFAWAYLIPEFSPLVLLPAVAGALLVLRYRARDVAILAAAAALTWCVEPLYGLVRYGNPFLHARLVLGRGDTSVSKSRLIRIQQVQDQLDNPPDTLLVFPRLLVSWHVGWVFLGLLAISARRSS